MNGPGEISRRREGVAGDAARPAGTAETDLASGVGHPARVGLDRLIDATGYSLSGLEVAARSETAFRQELGVALVLLPLAFWVGRNWLERSVLIGSLFLVLIVELLNSGIEAAVDRVSLDRHELSKRAKDLASAAVFLALLLCAGIWVAALWQRLA